MEQINFYESECHFSNLLEERKRLAQDHILDYQMKLSEKQEIQ